jgi:hypothetical protein
MPQEHISQARAVYTIAGMERAMVRKDLVYRNAADGPLTLDVYAPEGAIAETPLPAVVLVAGYNDAGYQKMLGVKFKEMAMSVSWSQLIAASGLIAITYTNREPAADLDALLQHVRDHAGALGIDRDRMALWACSGNVPLALSALMAHGRRFIRCGALLYGYMLDGDGESGVAEAAAAFRFTHPNDGKSLEDLPEDLPLLIVRAGREQFPHLNASIDRFFAKALTLNRAVTLVNHAEGPHSFDLLHDSDTSRRIIRQVLDFLAAHVTR